MKKIFTLLAASTLAVSAWAQQVTISWPLDAKGNYSATVTGDAASSIQAADVKLGENLYWEDKDPKVIQDISGILFLRTTAHTAAQSDDKSYINFPFTVANGKQFTITKITGCLAKTGSEATFNSDIFILDNEGNKRAIANEVAWERVSSKAPDGHTSLFYNQEFFEAKEGFNPYEGGTHNLVLNVYGKYAANKDLWISSIVIEGEIQSLGFVETRDKAPISWTADKVTYKIRDNVASIVLPELVNEENLALSFVSSNDAIASVDESGVVTLKNDVEGSAIIAASYVASDDSKYQSTTVEYTVEVVTNVKEDDKWMEYETVDKIELDNIYIVPKNDDSKLAATKLMDNDDITASTIFTAKYTDSYAANYLGYEFPSAVQIGRVKAAPTEATPTGTENTDSSPLIVTAKKDLKFVMFFRRQALEQKIDEVDDVENNVIYRHHLWGMSPNDGKGIKAVDQENVNALIDEELIFGAYCNEECHGNNDYLDCAAVWNFEAGKTYTIWATGTTICTNGFGYVAERDADEVFVKNHVIAFTAVDGHSTTDAEGYVVTRTGNNISKGNSDITVNGTKYTSIKMKGIIDSGEQIVYTITAPEGKVVTSATVYAIANSAAPTDDLYFTQAGNHNFTKEEATLIESKDGANPTVIAFDHIMLNAFDLKLHSGLASSDDISVVIAVDVIDAHHTPACPVLTMGEVVLEHGSEYDHDGKKAIEIAVEADADHEIYYNFTAAPAPAAPAEVRRAEEDLHAGYTKVEDGVISVPQAGTLKVYSYNPAKNLKSAPVAVSFKAPIVTGIENVTVDAAAEVEYFNLQGIRVANPENGVFIRRQGNDVKKVVR